jgi:hypothetical protein
MNVEPSWLPKTTVHLVARTHFGELLAHLRSTRTRVIVCDAALWKSEREAFVALASALDFPKTFGQNWDAFFDSFADAVSDSESFVVIIYGVKSFAAGALAAALRTVHHLSELSAAAAELRVFYVE